MAGYLFINIDEFLGSSSSTYTNFVKNYLEKDKIKSIEIKSAINGQQMNYYCYFTDIHGSVQYIQLSTLFTKVM